MVIDLIQIMDPYHPNISIYIHKFNKSKIPKRWNRNFAKQYSDLNPNVKFCSHNKRKEAPRREGFQHWRYVWSFFLSKFT